MADSASPIEIMPATTVGQVHAARSLMIEYRDSISTPLCFQGFDAEMAGLPGRYQPPSGLILLAAAANTPVGCVAVREIDPSPIRRVCEMKRLFVRSTHRGLGIGRLLAQAIIDESRRLGYSAMRLDTDRVMVEAQGLYESLGFRPIPRYNNDPIPDTLFFERVL